MDDSPRMIIKPIKLVKIKRHNIEQKIKSILEETILTSNSTSKTLGVIECAEPPLKKSKIREDLEGYPLTKENKIDVDKIIMEGQVDREKEAKRKHIGDPMDWINLSDSSRAMIMIKDCLKESGYYSQSKQPAEVTKGYLTQLCRGKNLPCKPIVCVVKKRIYKKTKDMYMLEVSDGVNNHKCVMGSYCKDMVKYKIVDKEDKILISNYVCTQIRPCQYIIPVKFFYPIKDGINVEKLVSQHESSC